jgi:hypothetical protein
MRRGIGVVTVIVLILAAIAIGVGAYNVGLNEGLEEARRGGEVVRVVGPGFGFPFGLILFPLFLFGIFALFRAAAWRGRWGGKGAHGPWSERAEEWHRQLHEQGHEGPSGPGSERQHV